MNNTKNTKVQTELLEILSSNLLYLNITLIINALVISLAFRDLVSSNILLAWIISFLIILSFHYLMRKTFVNNPNKYNIETYKNLFEIPIYLGNIIFSIGVVSIFPDDLPFYQTFLSMTIASIASVSVMSLSANRILIINYLIILILPLISMFSFATNYISSLIVLLYSLFLIVLIIFSKKYNKSIINLILAKIEVFQSKKEILRTQNDFSIIFEKAPIGIFTYNKNFIINDSNEAFQDISNLKKSKVIGLDLKKHFTESILDALSSVLKNKNGKYEGRYYHEILKKEIYINIQTAPMYNMENELSGGMALISDITKRIEDEKEIHHMAFYDHLTNIANRVTFNDRLNLQLSFLKRHKRYGAILFMDLDHFKTINDTLGHQIGDQVLKQFTKRINTMIRKEDTFSRFGGDEFVIMLPDLSDNEDDAISLVNNFSVKIHNLVKEAFIVDDNILQISLSIGITIISFENQDNNEILKQADISMYEAKQSGRNCSRFFLETMEIKVKHELTLTNELHNAIENNEFLIYYQPIVNTQNNIIESCEALVRWQHPKKGLIQPNDFIPFAEKHGLLTSIGYIVIEEVFKQYNKWEKLENLPLHDIAINISPKQFNNDDFIENLMLLINKYNVNPQHVKLELTESVIVDNLDKTISKINHLKEYGLLFSMDDFGTGYSSLSYLKHLPFNYLKIDQSFIENVLNDKNDVNLVKTILSISEQFGFKVIAEGVETQDHIDFLKKLDCNFYQGYVSSHPVPANEFKKLLN